MNEGHRIILVSAPPGYGKTTLISKWIESHTGPSVWLSLDEADNDPARFWACIIRGLQTVYDELGKSALVELGSPQPPPLQWLVSDLLNEIAALNQPALLVLDDYHVISAVEIHDTLAFALEHLPQALQLILSTRTDPLLPLARLRARDQLTEVRASDLRFTAEEANSFLNQRMGLGLSDENVAALEERTEGWIAGLHLAALSMQGRDPESAARFIATFSGRQHLILDYLTDEVLKRQPEPIQTFVLQTSVLNRMSGPLCDAVLGASVDSQATLESLEHANLFLVPLDDASQWYRYHHLFAELLRTRLQQAQPERISELHRRAAAWYVDNHFLDEAVAHAFAARDDALAVRLLEQVSQAMIMRGEISPLVQWLEALPHDLVRRSPRLSIDLALVRLLLDELSAVEPALQDAESTLVGADTQALSLREEVNAMRAITAIEQGRMVENIEHAAQTLDNLPQENYLLRAGLAYSLGIASRTTGDLSAATRAFVRCQSISEASRHILALLNATYELANLYVEQGHLHRAVSLIHREQQLVEGWLGNREPTLPVAGAAFIGLGAVLFEWNELEAARAQLEKGIQLADQKGGMGLARDGRLSLAFVLQAQGDPNRAGEVMTRAFEHAHLRAETRSHVLASQAHLALLQHNQAAVEQWAQDNQGTLEGEITFAYRRVHLTWARVLIAQHRAQDAVKLLHQLFEVANAAGWTKTAIEASILQALALNALGDLPHATKRLERALKLAEPEGFVRVFVSEGLELAGLLNHAAKEGVAVDYVTRLLAGFYGSAVEPASAASATDHPTSGILGESLTERELQVLQHLAEGLSNREIARKLYLSPNTLRFYNYNLYLKLGVHSRMQAVVRARQLGLLLPD